MEDDDDEDFRALFFTECEELLSDLQEHLDLLHNGEGDKETLNAAFRAVHSVKGGAAAFGFDSLISFAHAFETVMDLARSDQLELTADVCQILLRSGDVMEVLIERARDDDDSPSENMAKVLAELKELSDPGGSTEEAAAAPAPAPEPTAAIEDDEDLEEDLSRDVVVKFIPDPSFFRAGHDMLKVLKAAKTLGNVSVEAVGDILPVPEFSFDECTLSWILTIDTEADDQKIHDFFMVYEAAAQFEIVPDAVDEPEPAAIETVIEQPTKAPDVEATTPADKPAIEEVAPSPTEVPPQPVKGVSEPKPASETKPAAKPSKPAVSKSLRVELARVDRLVNLVGEIVITQASLAQKLTEVEAAVELEVGHSVEALSRQTRELQESVMAIRAQPVKSVFSRMPRVVRDLADKLNKDVRLELSGEQTEVDTTVIEELAEPLTHMLRNSMDHGLESPDKREAVGKDRTGTIRLSAEHQGERVIITLADDGAGINREIVLSKAIEKGLVSKDDNLTPEEIDHLIFHPGFSTAEAVSSVSGRGVGMDVVKRKIQELGGRCALKSEPGKGCIFTIALPLTLAILDGMTVCVGDERYILPLSNVIEALRLDGIETHELPDKSRVMSRRGEYLPILSIRKALQVPNVDDHEEDMAIIVDTETGGHVALLVDDLIGQRQVVLKSLEANYKRVEGVSGATILGDGRVALILDVPNLVTLNGNKPNYTQEFVH